MVVDSFGEMEKIIKKSNVLYSMININKVIFLADYDLNVHFKSRA